MPEPRGRLTPTRDLGWITFDLWSTLFHDSHEREVVRSRLRVERMAEVLRAVGEETTLESMERAYRESWLQCEQVWARDEEVGPEEQLGIILESLDPLLLPRLEVDARARLAEAYISPILDSPPVLAPHAREALAFARQAGLGIGLICNTGRSPGWAMREIFRRNRILDYFDVTVFSNEVGLRKPRPEIFQVAVEALKARPEQTVHVGDDVRADMQGARGSGLRAILVRPEPAPSTEAAYDVQIQHLGQLPEALSTLSAPPGGSA